MSDTTRTLVLDHVGVLAVNAGIVFYLSPCCSASATGSGNGVACRACYRPIADALGMGWLASDDAAWDRWVTEWLAADATEAPAAMVASNATLIRELAARIRGQVAA